MHRFFPTGGNHVDGVHQNPLTGIVPAVGNLVAIQKLCCRGLRTTVFIKLHLEGCAADLDLGDTTKRKAVRGLLS